MGRGHFERQPRKDFVASTRKIGEHARCGGEVVYVSQRTRGWRKCLKCGADGQHGRPSPALTTEVAP